MNFRLKQLVFVGGVHGVGKSTACKTICSDLGLFYLSASELIRWSELNDDPTNKLVKDIPDTQARLISAVNHYQHADGKYLLDGHFCLLNVKSEIIRISLRTFEIIAPSIICIITGNAGEIAKSQMARGGQVYTAEVIAEMQNCEIDHAHQVANHLSIPFIQTDRSSPASMIPEIKNTLNL